MENARITEVSFSQAQKMHHNWDSSNSGSTSIMTNNFDAQRLPWLLSQQPVQVKTEPSEYNNFLQNSDQPHHQDQPQLSPIFAQNTLDLLGQMPSFRQLGFNPLTPPECSPNLIYPQFMKKSHKSTNNKLSSPSKKQQDSSKVDLHGSANDSITPPIDVTPPKSPSPPDNTPEKDEGISNSLDIRSDSNDSFDDDSDECDDDDSNMMPDKAKKRRTNSNKPRQYKCKQCKQIFTSKSLFWDHTKSHIKPEKMLRCPECAFVTEYKHHLEYHLRNHSRSKPFQCPHCHYSCVNKSMLNSHLKSHSTVLQYRCVDCNYATKYCHSLKLHLRKYAHKPDIVLNLDGTPNPLPIIDVYGTRRGPKSKATTERLLAEIEKNQAQQRVAQKSQLSPPLTPSTLPPPTSTNNSITNTPTSSMLPNAAMMVNLLQNKMPLFPYFNLNFQMFAAQQKFHEENSIIREEEVDQEEADTNFIESPVEKPVAKSRTKRKGKAFKFEEKINETMCDSDENLELNGVGKIDQMTSLSNENSNTKVTSSMNLSKETPTASKEIDYECKFCGIVFKDNVLFSLHIGYHSLGEDPFRCNMCGTKTEDKVQFFLHIAKYPHS